MANVATQAGAMRPTRTRAVGTKHRAFSQPILTAGLLVEPGNVKALTGALRRLMENENERRSSAAGALAAAADLPTWRDTARIVAAALESLT